MTRFLVFALAMSAALLIGPLTGQDRAQALESYTPAQEQQFTDWCTGAKSNSESLCSCAAKNLAQTVPPVALSQFLANGGSFTMDKTVITTTAMVTQALTSCSR